MSNRSSQDMVPTRSTTNAQTFLETCVLDADHKALEEHLVSNPVQQSDLDRCLLRGLQTVQRKERELSNMAPALTILLQSGAKKNSDDLLDEQKTPYHIICESPGDHHELLDLVIKSSQQIITDAEDIDEYTALFYAVRNANVNCVRCLIANGADVNIGCDTYRLTDIDALSAEIKTSNPIKETIRILSSRSSTEVMSDIFDLLLGAAVEKNRAHFRSCTAYISYAISYCNVYSVKKLINLGVQLDTIACGNDYVWELIASMGNVEVLKCMFNQGIDKNITNQKRCIFWYVVFSGTIEAVRYLLDIGVAIPTCTPPEERTTQCDQCKDNILIKLNYNKKDFNEPCLRVIRYNMLEIVKLLDENGCQCYTSFTALRCAVKWGNEKVVSYLLGKYKYPLNIEYITGEYGERISTLLTDPFTSFTPEIIKLLLDHGADPAKPMCSATSSNAIMAATMYNCHLEVIAQYIRSGVDINFRSLIYKDRNVSPLELSVVYHRLDISARLLMSGCSREMFNNQKFMVKPNPNLKKLMKEWNMHDNNVTPLTQRCRCVILNHLSPKADLKIDKLPLPPCLIKFLSIPELDNIVYKYRTTGICNI